MGTLSNSDFRKLLETPRADRFAQQTPARGADGAGGKPKGGERKGGEKHGGGHKLSKKPAAKEQDEEDDEPKYRDRAEERRRGKNLDYEEASTMLSNLHADVDISKLSEAETKYLGGDMRFTHLVKGLDYALLEKSRSDMGTIADDDTGDGDDASMSKDARARAAAKANAADAASNKEPVRISTPMARGVYSTLFVNSRTSAAREMYLPRRTAFVYNFDDEEALDTDVPTTLRRPKSDCPPARDVLLAGVDNAVLQRIIHIMSYIRTTADGKKLKKKDRDALLAGLATWQREGTMHEAAPPAPSSAAAAGASGHAKAPADDDDIFADAGTDYKPAVKAAKQPQGGVAKAASYFSHPDAMEDIPMPGQAIKGVAVAAADAGEDMELEDGEAVPPPPPPLPTSAGAQGYYGAYGGAMPHPGAQYYGQQQAGYDGAVAAAPGYGGPPAAQQATVLPPQFRSDPSKWRSRPKDSAARALDAEADEDAYAEYYPSVAGFAGDVVDSDDEDYSHMDSKGNKGMSRADFATDEEWQRYKESRETLPRAAFQFGVKRADGRKSHKELEKGGGGADKMRDKKLDSQLRRIEKIMVDKGHEHTGAFTRTPRTPARGGGDGEPGATKKRQRI